MDKKEAVAAAKAIYQKGYSEGFTDACNLMRKAAVDLVESMNETLDSKISIVEQTGEIK